MIGRLKGTLLEKNAPWVLVDVQGVGYELQVPMSTLFNLPEINGICTLLTHLVVREDAHTLYGFQNIAEKKPVQNLDQGVRHWSANCIGHFVVYFHPRLSAGRTKPGNSAVGENSRHWQENS